MTAQRTERLLNLVIALLSTRRWLSKEQIRTAVPQYAEGESPEAFDRMFERDKEELRELGVPLVTGSDSAWFEDEVGYRIDREAYALPEISFTAAELAVLGLASRVWQQASLAGPAARALTKLKALGVETDEGSLVGVEPRVRTKEPAFEPLYAAARDRAPVSFTYATARTGEVAKRRVEPWVITSWHGRWYLVGHDRDRDGTRVFRLDRVRGRIERLGDPGSFTAPDDLDARALVSGLATDLPTRTARVRLAPGKGQGLRIRAASTRGGATRDVVNVPFHDVGEVAEQIAGHGPDAHVEGPDDVRDAVVERLRGALAAHTPEPGGTAPDGAPRRGRRARPSGKKAPREPRAGAVGERNEGAADRLSRLLAMVPWLLSRQGVPLAEAAQQFGISEDELVCDLELLFVCGAPGHMPDDLIEADWESGKVYLDNADAIARPLRLGLDEALTLLVGLRTLADVRGVAGRKALDGALAKLSSAAGEAGAAACTCGTWWPPATSRPSGTSTRCAWCPSTAAGT
jgi:predicted DNA-binding transcriptional regulator YafY